MKKEAFVIFEWHHIGDCVLALPFIRSAQQTFDVYVYCRPQSEPMLRYILPPERIIAMEPPWSWRGKGLWAGIQEFLAFRKRLKALKAKYAVCVWADVRAQLCGVLAGAKHRIGFAMTPTNYYAWEAAFERNKLAAGKWLQLGAEFILRQRLLTQNLMRNDYFQHHLDDWKQIAQALSLTYTDSAPWINLDRILALASPKIQQQHPKASERVCTLHTGARSKFKSWPLQHVLSLIQALTHEFGYHVRVICPPAAHFPEPDGNAYCVVKTQSLYDLTYICAQTDVFIGLDSAAGHIAAGLGKKVIALFGKMPATWFAPAHNQQHVVGGSLCDDRVTLRQRSHTMPKGFLLEHVTVEDVLYQVRNIEEHAAKPAAELTRGPSSQD